MPKLSDSIIAMFSMTGRVAIITGGSGGIGYEAGRALAEAGCNVRNYSSHNFVEAYIFKRLHYGIIMPPVPTSWQPSLQRILELWPGHTHRF